MEIRNAIHAHTQTVHLHWVETLCDHKVILLFSKSHNDDCLTMMVLTNQSSKYNHPFRALASSSPRADARGLHPVHHLRGLARVLRARPALGSTPATKMH